MTWDAYKIQKWRFVCFPCAAWYHMLSSLCCHSESGKTIYFPFQINLVILVRCRKQINYIRRLFVSINQEACHFPGLDPHERKWRGGGVVRMWKGAERLLLLELLESFLIAQDHSLGKHMEKQLSAHSVWSFLCSPRGDAPKREIHEPEIFHYAFGAVILTFPFSFECWEENILLLKKKRGHIQQPVFKYIPTDQVTDLEVVFQYMARYLWSIARKSWRDTVGSLHR